MKKLFNNKVFILSFVAWCVLHISGVSSLFIQNSVLEKTIIFNLMHFVFLYIIFYNILCLFRNRKTVDGKIAWKAFVIVSIIFIILIILVWPGVWSWDDIFLLDAATSLKAVAWQHFLCSIFYIMAIETIPAPAGIIIIQAMVISMIIAKCIQKIILMYGKTKKDNKILLWGVILISFFPPILMYSLSGFRMGIYSFCELYLIISLLFLYYNNKRVSLLELFQLCFFATIVSSLRTEGIYYCLMFPIILFFLKNNIIAKKTVLLCFMVVTISSIGIMKYNNYLIGNNNYSLTATIDPVSELVKNSKKSDRKQIEKINKVLDVDYIKKNPEKSGEQYFWSGECVKKYTDEEYGRYIEAYISLSMKYPSTVLFSMWDIFYEGGSGLGKKGIQSTHNMLSGQKTISIFANNKSRAFEKWHAIKSKYKYPFSKVIRENIILFFGGVDRKSHINLIHIIFWNYIIPIFLLVILFFFSIIKKDWFKSLIIITILLRLPILFITSPSPYFMYYLSMYLCGYILVFMTIFKYYKSSKGYDNTQKICVNKENKIRKTFGNSRWRQFLSFIIVSGIGWCIDFIIYNILTLSFKLSVMYANTVSSIPAITYVFLMSNKKIFKNKDSRVSIKMKYAIYFGYHIILLVVVSAFGELLYKILYNVVSIDLIVKYLKLIIKVLITPITMILNFIVMKNLIEKI